MLKLEETGNNEKALIAGLKEGDIECFGTLFRKYYPTFFAFVRGLVKNSHTAEDIVQNVFMKVWIHRGSLNEELSMRNFLFVLAKREVLNHFRAKYNLVKLTDNIDDNGESENNVETSYSMHELEEQLRTAIENMPQRRREVFVMSRLKHMSNKEIAEALGLSVRTVDRHIELALKYMREQFDRGGGGDNPAPATKIQRPIG